MKYIILSKQSFQQILPSIIQKKIKTSTKINIWKTIKIDLVWEIIKMNEYYL